MAALFIKDYRAELLRVGEAAFKTRHRTHVLVVTGRVAELVGEGASLTNGTAVATQTPGGSCRFEVRLPAGRGSAAG